MSAYNNILVAIDLGENSGDLIRKAQAIAGESAAVHVAYVHQRMESRYIGAGPIGSELAEISQFDNKLQTALQERLQDWANHHQVPAEQVHFLGGKPSRALREFALANNVDLIVIASHSKKGLHRLLGSTANAVVQKAECDVLAVRA